VAVRVAVGRRFAFGLRQGYDYISDIDCWPEYWPNLIRVEPGSRWTQAGDRARVTLKLLGRPTELEMTLSRVEPYRLIEYTSVQRGLPAACHERHFAEDRGGFGYRIVVELQPRSGPRAALDRLIVSRAVERAARQTVDNLERRFAELAATPTPEETHDHE
jgi:Polyketide cyclase / dehydrase and lipid transport